MILIEVLNAFWRPAHNLRKLRKSFFPKFYGTIYKFKDLNKSFLQINFLLSENRILKLHTG